MAAKTEEKVRDEFIGSIKNLVSYWSTVENISDREKCDGVAFSILTLMDGCSDMCGIDLVLRPCPEDKAYHKDLDEDWYEDGMVINNDMLHDFWHK